MVFKLKKLRNLLGKYKKIYVYGCGEYGEAFYDICMKFECVNKIKSFIVSSDESINNPLFHEIPIITVGNLLNEGKEQLVFVAMGRKNRVEVESFLVQKGLKNVAYMEDYIHKDDWENKDIRGYCQNIADWYVSEHIDQLGDYKKIVQDFLRVANARREKKFESKKIGFVISRIDGRIVRIAHSLQKQGYMVRVFCDGRGDAYTAEKELEKAGISIRKWRSEEELYYYLLHEPIKIFWVDAVAGNGDNDVSVHLLLQHEYFGKIIYAPYDIRHGSYSDIPTTMYKSERYSLENADGVIWRYLNNKEYLKEKFNIVQEKPSIEFLDYADIAVTESSERVNSNVLKLCSVLSHTHHALPRMKKNTQYVHTSPIYKFLNLMENRSDYIFDVYTWNATNEERKILTDLKKSYSNFNFYIHIEHDDLIRKLRTYDYGVSLHSGRCIPAWPINVDGYCENSILNSTCNSFFDCISAGIPIVSSAPVSFCALLKSYGILVDMTVEELDLDFLMQHRKEYRRNVVKAQKEFSIDNHIGRLVRFLDEVSGVSTKDEK